MTKQRGPICTIAAPRAVAVEQDRRVRDVVAGEVRLVVDEAADAPLHEIHLLARHRRRSRTRGRRGSRPGRSARRAGRPSRPPGARARPARRRGTRRRSAGPALARAARRRASTASTSATRPPRKKTRSTCARCEQLERALERVEVPVAVAGESDPHAAPARGRAYLTRRSAGKAPAGARTPAPPGGARATSSDERRPRLDRLALARRAAEEVEGGHARHELVRLGAPREPRRAPAARAWSTRGEPGPERAEALRVGDVELDAVAADAGVLVPGRHEARRPEADAGEPLARRGRPRAAARRATARRRARTAAWCRAPPRGSSPRAGTSPGRRAPSPASACSATGRPRAARSSREAHAAPPALARDHLELEVEPPLRAEEAARARPTVMPWRTARSCRPQKLSKPGRSARPLDERRRRWGSGRSRTTKPSPASAAASMQSIIVAW